jgi:hypothetical protein
MGTKPGVRKAHHQTGANDGGGGTAWFRKESLAPITSGPPGDVPAENEQIFLGFIALAAGAALPDSGPVLDCEVISLPEGQR